MYNDATNKTQEGIKMNSQNRNKKISLPARLRAAAMAQDLPYARILRLLAVFLGAAIMAGASLFGIARPFGLSFIAAQDGIGMILSATLGCVIGSVGQGDFLALSIASVLLCGARIFLGALFTPAELPAKKFPGGAKSPPGEMMTQTRPPEGESAPSPPGIFQKIRFGGATESIWLRAAFSATAAMITGAIRMVGGASYSTGELLSVFFLALVVPLSTLAFCTLTVRQLRVTSARDAGTLTLLFAITRAMRDVSGLSFNAGVICAFALSLIAARGLGDKAHLHTDSRRITYAAVCGLVCGLAIDPGGAPTYAASALIAAVIFPLSAAGAVCGGWLTAVAISFAGGGLAAFASVMPELTVTGAALIPLFHFRVIPDALPLPRPVITPSKSKAEAVEQAVMATARADAGLAKMNALSDALEKISGIFSAVSVKMRRPALSDLKLLCESALDRQCEGCENYALCREREYAATTDTLCRMTAELHKNGRVSAAVIPPHLASRCHKMNDILDEVNEGCAKYARVAVTADKSDVFADDFQAFSSLISQIARDTESEFTLNEEMSRKLQRSLKYMDFYAGNVTVYGDRRKRIMARDLDLTRVRMGSEDIRRTFEKMTGDHFAQPEYRLDGETVSMVMESIPYITAEAGEASRAAGDTGKRDHFPPNGDCITRFECTDGRYYVLICDGMGTGGEASLTARICSAFLEEILRAGADMTVALTMLNNYMRSRSLECSAGIDLMEIDRYTGEARFVKSGAAPSFVIREGRLFRLCSKTVPIGILRALDAEMIRFTLEKGDIIVMLSDGVTENFEDSAWLCDMLSTRAVTDSSPAEIAQRIVAAARAGVDPSRRDDVSAAVMKIA